MAPRFEVWVVFEEEDRGGLPTRIRVGTHADQRMAADCARRLRGFGLRAYVTVDPPVIRLQPYRGRR